MRVVYHSVLGRAFSVGFDLEALLVEAFKGVLDLLTPGEGAIRVGIPAGLFEEVVEQVVNQLCERLLESGVRPKVLLDAEGQIVILLVKVLDGFPLEIVDQLVQT